MIGAGIFVLTGIAAGTAGPSLILVFALNAVVTTLTAMVYAELGSAIPEAGGGYLWVKEGLPGWNAFLAGWMSWFAHAVAGSLYALGFGAYLELFVRGAQVPWLAAHADVLTKPVAVAIALVFVGINFKGVSETGKVGNVVTLGKIAILLIFIGSGLWAVITHPHYMQKFTPFAPHGVVGILSAMGLTFIAFEGYEIIVQAGEEVRRPRENIPKAIFLSLLITIPLYILVAFAAIAAVNTPTGAPTWQWLGSYAELGLAEAARQFMPLGTTLLLVGGLLSTMSALNATTFSSTRVSFALGRDGSLPSVLGAIHPRTRTPYAALLVSGALIILVAVALPIKDVAAATSVMFLLLFLQVNLAAITLRKKYARRLRYGYLVPFFPLVPYLSIVMILVLSLFMLNFSLTAWLFVVGWLGAGFVVYGFYASRQEREKVLTPVLLGATATAAPRREEKVLVATANPETAEALMRVGAALAGPRGGRLIALHVLTVPMQTPLTAAWPLVGKVTPLLEAAVRLEERLGVDVSPLVRLAHQPYQAIVETAEEREVDFVVLGWRGSSGGSYAVLGSNIDKVVKFVPCNVVVAQHTVRVPAGRVLIPIADLSNAPVMCALGLAMFDRSAAGGMVELLHVVPPGTGKQEIERRAREIMELLEDVREVDAGLDPRLRVSVEPASDVVSHIVSRTHESDLLIVGSSQETWLRRKILGEKPYLIAHRSHCPVIMLSPATNRVRFGIQTFFQFFREIESSSP